MRYCIVLVFLLPYEYDTKMLDYIHIYYVNL